MSPFLGWVAIQLFGLVCLIGLIIASIFYFDRRYKRRHTVEGAILPQPGFLPTSEVFIDPADGHRYRVYYNPKTGLYPKIVIVELT